MPQTAYKVIGDIIDFIELDAVEGDENIDIVATELSALGTT